MLFCLLYPQVSAAVFTIAVSSDSIFTPSTVEIAPGDILSFTISSPNQTVIESDRLGTCLPKPNGFQISSTQTMRTFNVTVSESVTFYLDKNCPGMEGSANLKGSETEEGLSTAKAPVYSYPPPQNSGYISSLPFWYLLLSYHFLP